jgi:hypothetical protein
LIISSKIGEPKTNQQNTGIYLKLKFSGGLLLQVGIFTFHLVLSHFGGIFSILNAELLRPSMLTLA